ncbi:hypothetical protein [Microbacterium sp. CIAB417]|uniref:hypothetical protein n=1 Tax=Microbacterium sp. CIAB417 TaxID=2860287 RepID=UPI001FAE046F|nr:hypothetical protein [Microbacterium sp. CIAB417]
MTAPGPRSTGAGLRILGIVLTALFGVPFLVFTVLVLSSRFGGAFDPHGYTLIFGTLFALVLAIPTAVSIPLVFPAGRRLVAAIISLAAFLVVGIGLFAALLTA